MLVIIFYAPSLTTATYLLYCHHNTGFFVSLVPEEKVTELWGFNSFCSVVLSWVPPLIFASLNESTGNLVGLS